MVQSDSVGSGRKGLKEKAERVDSASTNCRNRYSLGILTVAAGAAGSVYKITDTQSFVFRCFLIGRAYSLILWLTYREMYFYIEKCNMYF